MSDKIRNLRLKTNLSAETREVNAEQKLQAKVKAIKSADLNSINLAMPFKKINATICNLTCQAKDADAEQKFHMKVAKNLFRRRRSSSNENFILSDGWLMEGASSARSVNSADKLAVKSTASIDTTGLIDSTCSIRISNLPESMDLTDLSQLVQKIGRSEKIYLKQDPETGDGFAYVNFKQRKDAARAIQLLDGHTYDHLFLRVEYSYRRIKAPKKKKNRRQSKRKEISEVEVSKEKK